MALCAVLFFYAASSGFSAESAKREDLSFYGLESGRFEVVALAGPEGSRLGALAGHAWAVWRGPFGLPERWPVGITVRLAPAANWTAGAASWRVAADPGGIVSIWVRTEVPGGPLGVDEERRILAALAAGAMHRQAVFIGVPADRVTTPAWLGAAAAEAVIIRQQPSLSDAWQRDAATWLRVPALNEIVNWKVAEPAPDARVRAAAFGVWSWLQADGARSGAWRRFLAEVLAGGDAMGALARNYGTIPGRGSSQELELAWQTAFAQFVRSQNVPVLEPVEARRWLEQINRVVILDTSGGVEQAFELSDLWARRKETDVRVQLEDRSSLLAANLRLMHPFYRNAAGSLGRAWLALLQGKEGAWQTAREELRQDIEAGRELETASKRILDGPAPAAAP